MKTIAVLPHSQGDTDKMYQPSLLIQEAKKFFNYSEKKTIATTKSVASEITIFLVDDDALFSKALEHSISAKLPSIKIQKFQTGESCLQQMKLKPQIVILDYYLNSQLPYAWNGLTILRQIKKINPSTKVIMLSSQDSLEIAVKCIDNGSFDYISKSESAFVKINNVLTNIVENVKANRTGLHPYQIISLIIIIILTLCVLLK
jgi:two-component system OmpR family response regulator